MKKFEEDVDEPTTRIEKLVELILEDSEQKKTILVGARLNQNERVELVDFLQKNIHEFAWSHEDIPWIDPEHTTHRLNIDPTFPPVKQKQ